MDAPELHFPVIGNPSKAAKYPDFRQPYGASAASALGAHLQSLLPSGGTVIHAWFVTQIDKPNDAIDSHGRFVGDIIVGTAGGKSINVWLVEHGWAYPFFYDTMTVPEVQRLLPRLEDGARGCGSSRKGHAEGTAGIQARDEREDRKAARRRQAELPEDISAPGAVWTEIAGPLSVAQFVARLNKKIPASRLSMVVQELCVP